MINYKKLHNWEQAFRERSINYKRENMKCGYGARIATVREEVQTPMIVK